MFADFVWKGTEGTSHSSRGHQWSPDHSYRAEGSQWDRFVLCSMSHVFLMIFCCCWKYAYTIFMIEEQYTVTD